MERNLEDIVKDFEEKRAYHLDEAKQYPPEGNHPQMRYHLGCVTAYHDIISELTKNSL